MVFIRRLITTANNTYKEDRHQTSLFMSRVVVCMCVSPNLY